MHKIKFSKCPLGKHQGEYWEKLNGIPNGSVVKLKSVAVVSPDYISEEKIKLDTFHDYDINDFFELLEKFYGFHPFLIELAFSYRYSDNENEWVKGFTTFRAYEWRKHKYYLDNLGKEFEVVMT